MKYIEECNQPEKKVHLTYILGGTTSAGKRKVLVVDENKYETVKSELKNIFIDKIYSLQKSSKITWESIFNIDDFLYTEKKILTPVSKPENKNEEPKRVEKKGSISNFLNQQKTNKEAEKKPPPKVEKKNNIKNMFSKIPPKSTNGVMKNKIEDDDDEDIVRRNKKRSRVMIDDDEEEDCAPKHAKPDLLESDNDSEKENGEY